MTALPKWVVEDAQSVAEEAAPYVDMTPEERMQHLAAACRAAARLLKVRDDARAALDYVDPIPDSTARALVRLRAAASSTRHDSDSD